MKLCRIVTMSLFCVLMVGCTETENVNTGPDKRLANIELVDSFNDIAMENAIISQHTLFPYHFVKNGAELNELGQRDMAVLAKHFVEHPGHLNIRRNNVADNIYEARANLVLDKLKEAGVNTERMTISDGMPGGSGIASERVLTILEKAQQATPTETTTGVSTGVRR